MRWVLFILHFEVLQWFPIPQYVDLCGSVVVLLVRAADHTRDWALGLQHRVVDSSSLTPCGECITLTSSLRFPWMALNDYFKQVSPLYNFQIHFPGPAGQSAL
jgi:hypothetical protein